MDLETAEAVEALRADMHRVERDVIRVEREVIRVEASLSAKMDEHKRHGDVHFESVHGDIRMLAEHLVSLTIKVDTLLQR
jgi:hypothetical protein